MSDEDILRVIESIKTSLPLLTKRDKSALYEYLIAYNKPMDPEVKKYMFTGWFVHHFNEFNKEEKERVSERLKSL